jgi:hypothetical protein
VLSLTQKAAFKDIGHALAKGIMGSVFTVVGLISIASFGFRVVFPADIDATDKSATQRSGLVLRVDYATGCEYLESKQGYLVPRLGKDHQPICSGDTK